jgi:signal transduction histidine kinase
VDSPPDIGNAQQFVTIKIADTGPGMTPEVKARLFDPFFTTKPVGAGTGLGMSISYQIIVKQHRGHLQCISEVGRGTEMAIVIPVRQTQSERPIKN